MQNPVKPKGLNQLSCCRKKKKILCKTKKADSVNILLQIHEYRLPFHLQPYLPAFVYQHYSCIVTHYWTHLIFIDKNLAEYTYLLVFVWLTETAIIKQVINDWYMFTCYVMECKEERLWLMDVL